MSFTFVVMLCFLQFSGAVSAPEQRRRQVLAWQARQMAEPAQQNSAQPDKRAL
jgi:hypothetical protein